MADEDALLAAVCAAPDDDLPRLAYADWLDDHGDPDRAAFIRLQVERARLPGKAHPYHELFDREAGLLARHRDEWAAPFRPWAGFDDLLFRRGFVDQLTCSAEAYLADPAGLFGRFPVREVWLRDAVPLLDRLFRVSRPPHVRVRAGELMPPTSWDPGDGFVDLLPVNPPAAEPYLRRGSWLVLAFRTDRDADVVAAHRFVRYVQRHMNPADETGYGLRPLDRPDELRAWCSAAVDRRTPVWVRLDEGAATRHWAGPDPPAEWQPNWLAG